MRKHVAQILVLAAFLCVSHALMAGYYVNDSRFTGLLTIGKRVIAERDGQAVATTAMRGLEPWNVNISHVISRLTDRYLAYPLQGESAKVGFADKQGDGVEWNIEIVRRLEPAKWGIGQGKAARGVVGPLLEGTEGIAFHLSARNGTFKGRYLAEGAVDDAKAPLPLILVRDKKQAATLVYEEKHHRPVDVKEKQTR